MNNAPLTVGAVARIDSKNEKHVFLFQIQPAAKCDLCGKVAELRPYGPNGENICFQCGEKNPEATEKRFIEVYQRAMGYK